MGDFKNKIWHLIHSSLPSEASLISIFFRNQGLIKEFNQVFSWHIGRDINYLPDELANKGVYEEIGSLVINGRTSFSHVH
jgi:hypothetical protein